MSLVGEGPLAAEENLGPVWLGNLIKKLGQALGAKIVEKVIDYAGAKIAELAGKQDAQAEKIEQDRAKEDEIIGGMIDLKPSEAGSSVPPDNTA